MTVTNASFITPALSRAERPAAEHDLLLPDHRGRPFRQRDHRRGAVVHRAGPDAARYGGDRLRRRDQSRHLRLPDRRRRSDSRADVRHRVHRAVAADRAGSKCRGVPRATRSSTTACCSSTALASRVRDRRQRRLPAGDDRLDAVGDLHRAALARVHRQLLRRPVPARRLRPDVRLGVRAVGDLQHAERRAAVRAHQHRRRRASTPASAPACSARSTATGSTGKPSSVDYYVDGALVASHALTVAGPMRPVAASDFNPFGGTVFVDWMRMSPYARQRHVPVARLRRRGAGRLAQHSVGGDDAGRHERRDQRPQAATRRRRTAPGARSCRSPRRVRWR